jgi:hypothetical protein
MMQVARSRNASWMSSRRSQRVRRRFMPWYQAIVRSTTQRYTPRPEPCGSPRRAIRGPDPLAAQDAPVLVVVVGTIAEQFVGAAAWSTTPALDGWDRLYQGFELGDVVTVAAAQVGGQRDARAMGQNVVFRARSGTVDRARSAFGPRRSARMWEESMTALDQSSLRPDATPRAAAGAAGSRRQRCSTAPADASTSSRTRIRAVGGQELPLDPGVQHEQDPAQHLPIR